MDRAALDVISVKSRPIPSKRIIVQTVPAHLHQSASIAAGDDPQPWSSPPTSSQVASARTAWWPGLVWVAGFGFLVARTTLSRLFFLVFWRPRRPVVDLSL